MAGWTFSEFPLRSTKRPILEGLRFHVMRFAKPTISSGDPVVLENEAEFTRPIRLYRRDPRGPPSGGQFKNEETVVDGVDDKERERIGIERAQRQAQREANLAQIAPVAKQPTNPQRNPFGKKTEQVYHPNDTEEGRKKNQLRYEETLPWHLEDFDNKNIWTGSYEAALSRCHVMLVIDDDGFRIVPVEKWYKFSQKSNFKKLTIDEAEKRMDKKFKDPRWLAHAQRAQELSKRSQQKTSNLIVRKGDRGEDAAIKREEGGPDIAHDVDDIDYDYDEAFADDEENPLFEGDQEESKEAEEKVKREQREANVFEIKEEKDWDKEEQEEEEKARQERKLAKSVRKALMRQEKNYAYEDESEESASSDEVRSIPSLFGCLPFSLFATPLSAGDGLERLSPRTSLAPFHFYT